MSLQVKKGISSLSKGLSWDICTTLELTAGPIFKLQKRIAVPGLIRSQSLFCFEDPAKLCSGPHLRECSLALDTPALYSCGLSADMKTFLEPGEPSCLHGGEGRFYFNL